MRKFLYLFTLTLISSCGKLQTRQPQVTLSGAGKFKNLLSKYKYITIDTLKIFSDVDLENDLYKFKGQKLDSTDILLFPKSIAEAYLDDDGYFACYKFLIDSQRTGLITRTPSTYTSTSIKLLVLNTKKESITDVVELAESVGDAGDILVKKSWIFKDKHNKGFKSLIWIEERHDNSVEIETDTTIQHWNNYFLVDLNQLRIDTVNTDEKALKDKFSKLLKE